MAVTNNTLPPDASPLATPGFDVHIGRCPPINKNCDNLPVRYYCASDLACFSWQKCCLNSCSYVCSSSTGWWETRETGEIASNLNDDGNSDNTNSSANEKEDENKLHTEMGQVETDQARTTEKSVSVKLEWNP